MSATGVVISFVVWRILYAIFKTILEYQYVSHLFDAKEKAATFFLALFTGPIGMWLHAKTDLGCVGTFFLYLFVFISILVLIFTDGSFAFWFFG